MSLLIISSPCALILLTITIMMQYEDRKDFAWPSAFASHLIPILLLKLIQNITSLAYLTYLPEQSLQFLLVSTFAQILTITTLNTFLIYISSQYL
jgi:hypothetical protein